MVVSTSLFSCPVSDGVLSFKQRKKVPKEAPQGTNGSLTSFAVPGKIKDFSDRGDAGSPCSSHTGVAEQNVKISATRIAFCIFPGWKCGIVVSPLFAAAPFGNVGAGSSAVVINVCIPKGKWIDCCTTPSQVKYSIGGSAIRTLKVINSQNL